MNQRQSIQNCIHARQQHFCLSFLVKWGSIPPSLISIAPKCVPRNPRIPSKLSTGSSGWRSGTAGNLPWNPSCPATKHSSDSSHQEFWNVVPPKKLILLHVSIGNANVDNFYFKMWYWKCFVWILTEQVVEKFISFQFWRLLELNPYKRNRIWIGSSKF